MGMLVIHCYPTVCDLTRCHIVRGFVSPNHCLDLGEPSQKQTPFSQLFGSVQPFNSYFDELLGSVNCQAAFLSPFLSSKYVAFLCHLHGPDGYIPSEKQKGTGGRLDSKQSSQMEGRRKQLESAHCAGKDGEWLAKSHGLVF